MIINQSQLYIYVAIYSSSEHNRCLCRMAEKKREKERESGLNGWLTTGACVRRLRNKLKATLNSHVLTIVLCAKNIIYSHWPCFLQHLIEFFFNQKNKYTCISNQSSTDLLTQTEKNVSSIDICWPLNSKQLFFPELIRILLNQKYKQCFFQTHKMEELLYWVCR